MTSPAPDDWDDAPFVCPGCRCIGAEPHKPGCIDAQIEEALADRSWRDEFYDADLNGAEDWEFLP